MNVSQITKGTINQKIRGLRIGTACTGVGGGGEHLGPGTWQPSRSRNGHPVVVLVFVYLSRRETFNSPGNQQDAVTPAIGVSFKCCTIVTQTRLGNMNSFQKVAERLTQI